VTINNPGNSIGGKTAIAGIGATEFSKESGRSEMQLACEAVTKAIADAGLTPSDVDGLVSYTAETNPEIDIARHTGIGELRHFSRVHYGGGAACGTVAQAAMAVSTGMADVVVCYRAFNERSGRRFGAGIQDHAVVGTAEQSNYAYTSPIGLLTPASWVAMCAQRYMHV
jgi:acetyl-CoA acetyltransferase